MENDMSLCQVNTFVLGAGWMMESEYWDKQNSGLEFEEKAALFSSTMLPQVVKRWLKRLQLLPPLLSDIPLEV